MYNLIFYLLRNNKRVAEIWLDQYKKYLYMRHPERYRNLDIGDISRQLALKKSLNCKPFSYFFDKIAPDSLKRFPLEEYVHFASGTVSRIKAVEVNL
jgi:polypeptide N-acetylgalactosaminyltransferase